MHAKLIILKDRAKLDRIVSQIVTSKNALVINYSIQKIEDVRNLQKEIKIGRSEQTFYVIPEFNHATEEAQNAFLKNLEEPPANTEFILQAETSEGILPTIISRCQIIKIKTEDPKIDSVVEEFTNLTTDKKISYISKIQSRDDARNFIEQLIIFLHQTIRSGNPNKERAASHLKRASETIRAINLNGNVYLQLLNFVVNLD